MKNVFLFIFLLFLTVSARAVVAPITGSASLCLGSGTTLADATPGGAWSSSDLTIATVGSSTGIVIGISPGATTITYTVGAGFATVMVTVNPLPPAITGTMTICTGGTTTLANVVAGGVWSSSNPAVVTVAMATGVATGVTAGTASISYALSTGCFATTVVTVGTGIGTAPIGGSPSVCIGTPSTLTNTTPGGTWISSNVAVASVGSSSGVVTGGALGTATISYMVPSGCFSTIIVTVNGASCSGMPAGGTTSASSSVICGGNSALLSLGGGATVGCGMSYQWQSSPNDSTWTNIGGAITTSCVAAPPATTYYRVILTCSTSGLSAASASVSVGVDYSITVDSVINDGTCSASHFYVRSCGASSSYSLTTWFGDGTSASTALTGGYYANIYHSYAMSGTYTVKHVLYYSGAPVDSSSRSYEYHYCQNIAVKLFKDENGNGIFDAVEGFNTLPVAVKVDSNGVAIDTVVATSGFFLPVYGGTGTVYRMSILPLSGGRVVSCPSSGIIYDTIVAGGSFATNYFGISCSAAATFDLAVSATKMCGRHSDHTVIKVTNNSCAAASPVITVKCSPKYSFVPASWLGYAWPAPSSVSGNIMTWNLSSLAAGTTNTITLDRERPIPWLIPGDTVQTTIIVDPSAGDGDTTNNVIIRVDTVKYSYDPNHIAVSPEGNVLPCTKLQYTVDFENDGNDTAHNIYVLDTLSTALVAGSLEPMIASAPMNMSIVTSGGYKIARFDFPNIKLLDSSHHGQCNGMFVFNINVKPGLIDGTGIMNRVGIYFDDNPVVMTNQVNNAIGINPIVGPGSLCVGDSVAVTDATPSGAWSATGTSASLSTASWGRWVMGVSAGTTAISYTVSNSCAARTATKSITVNIIPSVAAIAGITSICAGATTSLSDATTGGAWSSTAGGTAAISSAGLVSAVAAGTTTISYTVTNACGTSAATMEVTVNPLVTPAVTTTPDPGATVCDGSSVTFTPALLYGGTAPAYIWKKNGVVAATSAAYSFVPADGDIIQCFLVSNYTCRSADTVVSSATTMAVDPMYIPSISLSAVPGYNISAGESITLTASAASAGPSPSYQWILGAVPIVGATNSTYTSSSFLDNDSITCAVTGSGACHVLAFKSAIIHVGSSVNTVAADFAMELFPNPGAGTFTVRANVPAGFDRMDVKVRDVLGQLVYDGSATVKGGSIDHSFTLPATLANGVYMLELRSPAERNVVHFVLRR